jgi:hypothetical protein
MGCSIRQASKENWNLPAVGNTIDVMRTGALMRIADSLEKMERPFLSMLEETARAKSNMESTYKTNAHLYRRIASLKGVITRQKRKKK